MYAVKILFQKKVYKGIANFDMHQLLKEKKLVLECFIFNKINNLYGKVIEVQFIKFIRGEKIYVHRNAKKQIKYDIDKTRRILKMSEIKVKTKIGNESQLPNKEPDILKYWDTINLYELQKHFQKREKFILHDVFHMQMETYILEQF